MNIDFLTEFKNKGYFHQCTNEDALVKLTNEKKIACYVGFDCTATSLHIGSLMQIMILRLLQKHGHKPIILIGGGTTRIGDPSGKDKTREYLSDEKIQENIAGIKKSLSKFISFGEKDNDAIIVNNEDWLMGLKYIEFLRDYGRLFSVNKMLTRDSVKLRLEREQSLTFLEFNYSLLQAYDFYHLYDKYNCALQLGGSDQWGNIVSGVELIRKITTKEAFGLTTPLLTTASGQKMGKTASGAVWLNEDECAPYEYYQYWRNCHDEDIMKFALLFAEYDQDQLSQLEGLLSENINQAKKMLAYDLTKICHGKEAADESLNHAIKLFENKDSHDNLPKIQIKLTDNISVIDLFIEANLASSKGEVRRLIRGKGAKLNDQTIEDENLNINMQYLKDINVSDNIIKLSFGKKKHAIIKLI